MERDRLDRELPWSTAMLPTPARIGDGSASWGFWAFSGCAIPRAEIEQGSQSKLAVRYELGIRKLRATSMNTSYRRSKNRDAPCGRRNPAAKTPTTEKSRRPEQWSEFQERKEAQSEE
jgi:hypothetical protein